VVNADGSGKLTITAPTGRGSSPTWAPDSQRLAFDAWGGQASLYTAKGDGTGVAPVGTGAYANEPAWSPKGHKIAFLGGSRLFVMNADGTGETALTPAGRYDIFGGPAWSPDGRKLAFWAYPTGAPYPDLYVLNADGTGLNAVATLLLGEPAERKMDLTSPFVWQKLRSLRHPANWGGLADLFTTRSWTSPSGFCWSPDSTMLAFVSRARPRPGTRVLSVVLNLLAVPFFALCGPAAIVLSLRTWWRQGPIPGTVTGLLAGGIATVIYGLLLVLIVGAMCAG